jgi:hypothetical protein
MPPHLPAPAPQFRFSLARSANVTPLSHVDTRLQVANVPPPLPPMSLFLARCVSPARHQRLLGCLFQLAAHPASGCLALCPVVDVLAAILARSPALPQRRPLPVARPASLHPCFAFRACLPVAAPIISFPSALTASRFHFFFSFRPQCSPLPVPLIRAYAGLRTFRSSRCCLFRCCRCFAYARGPSPNALPLHTYPPFLAASTLPTPLPPVFAPPGARTRAPSALCPCIGPGSFPTHPTRHIFPLSSTRGLSGCTHNACAAVCAFPIP